MHFSFARFRIVRERSRTAVRRTWFRETCLERTKDQGSWCRGRKTESLLFLDGLHPPSEEKRHLDCQLSDCILIPRSGKFWSVVWRASARLMMKKRKRPLRKGRRAFFERNKKRNLLQVCGVSLSFKDRGLCYDKRDLFFSFLARYLVDPASSHMLVSKIKPCMSKYKPH